MDNRDFRDILGKFATGVCVITTSADGVPAFGMTVNSFCSLSLSPPLVMWSIGESSDCFSDFEKVGRYAVNILREDQQYLSARYSKKAEHALHDGDWEEGKSGCPVLAESLASVECEIETRVNGGDHVILIGRVLSASAGDEAKPLLFYSGRYAELTEQ
ncbi:flavin reductase [Halioglobus maricola]|uniref:Flavin reductase n=1 Tax=Halioglobus maricola TaxID=2601894 RepID=A0A5P9NN03_9GAMM|nr:flavin reductase family protein [Halioglobus maricola]QFU77201.1 flavin reductase [Halioglobus maricola]